VTHVIHCECGFDAKGETEDDLVAAVEQHVKEAHPDMADNMSREQILSMAHEH
jgi:predicted small metal-binding protein